MPASADEPRAPTSCCSETPLDLVPVRAASGGCCDDGGLDIPANERPCGCVHGPNDVAVTTPAITANGGKAAPANIDVLLAAPPAITAAATPDRASTCRGSPGRRAGPLSLAGSRSLLALHCQLTT